MTFHTFIAHIISAHRVFVLIVNDSVEGNCGTVTFLTSSVKTSLVSLVPLG